MTKFISNSACRVCLNECSVMVNVFDFVSEYKKTISELLAIYGNLKIDVTDEFTKLICETCTNELLLVVKFNKKCKNSIATFNRLLNIRNTTDSLTNITFILTENGPQLIKKEPFLDDNQYIDINNKFIINDETNEKFELILNDENLSRNESILLRKNVHSEHVHEEEDTFESSDFIQDSNSMENDENDDTTYKKYLYHEIPIESNEDLINERLQNDIANEEAVDAVDDIIDDNDINMDNEGVQDLPYEEIEYLDANSGAVTENVQKQDKYILIVQPNTIENVNVNTEDEDDVLSSGNNNNTDDNIIEEDINRNESNDDGENISTVFITDEELKAKALEENNNFIEITEDDDINEVQNDKQENGEHGSVPLTYFCELCGAGFAHANNLARHRQTHNVATKFSCPICDEILANEDSLNEHWNNCALVSKGEKAKRNHKCHFCAKCFVSNSLLASHIRVHTGEKPYKCEFINANGIKCKKAFATQGGLDLHTRRHTGLKPFKCSYCNSAFVESSNLKVHIRTHTGEKPHKCTLCNRSFSRVYLLQLHVRTHTGERPYICGTCSKGFAQQGDLAAHMRIHTGERPHKCKICDRGFIKSSALITHIKRHKIVKCGEDESG